ncbi:MAG: hypothetical protein ACHQ17_09800, partial [Polyangia bacterium]
MPPEPQAATQPLALQLAEMQTRLGQVEADARQNRLSMVVFSGSLDRIIASLVLATTAAASGMEV